MSSSSSPLKTYVVAKEAADNDPPGSVYKMGERRFRVVGIMAQVAANAAAPERDRSISEQLRDFGPKQYPYILEIRHVNEPPILDRVEVVEVIRRDVSAL